MIDKLCDVMIVIVGLKSDKGPLQKSERRCLRYGCGGSKEVGNVLRLLRIW